jgi:hypothetical protein
MELFKCGSQLTAICRASKSTGKQQVIVWLRHLEKHKPYYDVAMPPEAAAMIHDDIEWQTPVSMVPKIQALYPVVTAQKIHAAWTSMSETLWKRAPGQLESVMLLLENHDDINIFRIDMEEGVEQVCWGMNEIISCLKGDIVEVAVDATCEHSVYIKTLADGGSR